MYGFVYEIESYFEIKKGILSLVMVIGIGIEATGFQ